jgi:very-short-patch-repair endonuclease
MAAVLAGGPGAVLSHRSAAALWGVLAPGFVDVTVRGQNRLLRGVCFHRSRLPDDETTRVDGIPVTTVPRTLMDLAAILRSSQVERAINEAEIQRLTDPLSLPDLLDRYPARPGTPAIRAILTRLGSGAAITHSELEDRFLTFIADWRLPPPEVNVWLQIHGVWVECDCVWRSRRVIVELDGRATHGTAAAFERDRARDRRLHAAGWRTVRITWQQLQADAQALAGDLRAVLGRPSL